jgi:DNA-directed RNA polymerase specialized sigma24 family protein
MRADLVAAAVRVPARDREDVVQEALLRLVREEQPRPGVPLKAQARRRLQRATADYYRRESRRPRLTLLEPEEQGSTHEVAASEAESWRKVRAFRQRLEELAGRDAALYAVLKGLFKMSEREIAELPGWNANRAGAARKQLSRAKERFPELIDDTREA